MPALAAMVAAVGKLTLGRSSEVLVDICAAGYKVGEGTASLKVCTADEVREGKPGAATSTELKLAASAVYAVDYVCKRTYAPLIAMYTYRSPRRRDVERTTPSFTP